MVVFELSEPELEIARLVIELVNRAGEGGIGGLDTRVSSPHPEAAEAMAAKATSTSRLAGYLDRTVLGIVRNSVQRRLDELEQMNVPEKDTQLDWERRGEIAAMDQVLKTIDNLVMDAARSGEPL